MEEQFYPAGRWFPKLCVLGGVFVAAGCVLAVVAIEGPLGAAALAAICFAGGGLIIYRGFQLGRPIVRVTDEGITVHGRAGIAWEDIQEMGLEMAVVHVGTETDNHQAIVIRYLGRETGEVQKVVLSDPNLESRRYLVALLTKEFGRRNPNHAPLVTARDELSTLDSLRTTARDLLGVAAPSDEMIAELIGQVRRMKQEGEPFQQRLKWLRRRLPPTYCDSILIIEELS
jgi:hypothetical protein